MKVLNFNFGPKHLSTVKESDCLRSLKFLFLCYRTGQTVSCLCVSLGQLCKHLFFLYFVHKEWQQVKVSVPFMRSYVFEITVFFFFFFFSPVHLGKNFTEYILDVLVFVGTWKYWQICQCMKILRKKKFLLKSARILKWQIKLNLHSLCIRNNIFVYIWLWPAQLL